MPAYPTPAPVSVTARMEAGSIRFTAAERSDTVVGVRPRDPEKDLDVRTAERTEVTCANGVLTIRTPRSVLPGRTGAVEVTVCLPAGSDIDLTGTATQVTGAGRLGRTRVETASGDARFDTTGPLKLATSQGSLAVDRVEGPAEISTGSGSLRVGHVGGTGVLKNSHGSTVVGTATGELRVSSADGDIEIRHAGDSVTATTVNGTLRIAEVTRGAVRVENSRGPIEIGVREGTAVVLDAISSSGQVHNTFAPPAGPDRAGDTVKIHARALNCSIDVHRATV
ncbi:DUF4097 family beta strand repeat-containing protein [Streptomyces tsukubensis]|uniref:DUF4097 family beta strand repeat-containing protein n=1 Tax=Streptomyces tsukubensis TaxID=83656 RepID=UPI00344BBB7F